MCSRPLCSDGGPTDPAQWHERLAAVGRMLARNVDRRARRAAKPPSHRRTGRLLSCARHAGRHALLIGALLLTRVDTVVCTDAREAPALDEAQAHEPVVRRRVLRQGRAGVGRHGTRGAPGDLRCVGVPRRRSRHAAPCRLCRVRLMRSSLDPAPRMARIGRRRRASDVRARTSASVGAGVRAGVSRPQRRREAVRVRPRELLEGRLPIASRCSITCALEDGLTDSVGHCAATIAERSNEVEPPPGRNRGSYSRNRLAHAHR